MANEGQRRLVSAEAWSLFQKYFPSAPAFEALSDPCQLCMVRSVGCCTPTVQGGVHSFILMATYVHVDNVKALC